MVGSWVRLLQGMVAAQLHAVVLGSLCLCIHPHCTQDSTLWLHLFFRDLCDTKYVQSELRQRRKVAMVHLNGGRVLNSTIVAEGGVEGKIKDMFKLEHENYSALEAAHGCNMPTDLSKSGIDKGATKSHNQVKEVAFAEIADKILFCHFVWEETFFFFSLWTWVFACFFVQCHRDVGIFRSRSEQLTSSFFSAALHMVLSVPQALDALCKSWRKKEEKKKRFLITNLYFPPFVLKSRITLGGSLFC